MKSKIWFIAGMLAIGSLGTGYAQPVLKNDVDAQTSVEVTVYNSNLGLVKDTRSLSLPEGDGELRFMGVASSILPVTVRARSLNEPAGLSILEQNYEYDLMSEEKLLDKYVGKKIKIIDSNPYQDRKDILEAVLLSNNGGQIYKIGDEIFLGHPGLKVLPEVPENLIARPTLTWLFRNKTKKPHQLEVSYLTENISWKADYILVLAKDDLSADLSGWVTIDNRSGAGYKNATLKLVAGEVNRAQEAAPMGGRYMKVMAMDAGSSQFEEKSFFEYHIYDLQRKTTLKDNQTKQISLLEAAGIKVAKEFLVQGEQGYFTSQYGDQSLKQPVTVSIYFKNSKENRLGMPLPAGVMRLYKQDASASLQFVGEDTIGHTPKDEEVKLKIGEAFDLVAERKQIDFKQVSTRAYETEWEVTLRNRKQEDVVIGVVEPVYGSWQVLSTSHPHKKIDAFKLRFDIAVPKDKEVKIKYRMRVGI